MAIQHNFKQAYTNKVSQQNQGINTITQGVKSTAVLVGGAIAGAGMAMGASGVAGLSAGGSGLSGAMVSFAESGVGKMVFQQMAGKIGGIGGNLMAQTMQEKLSTAVSTETTKETINNSTVEADTVARMTSELKGNPINNNAIKQINTVYDTILKDRENKILAKASKQLGKDVTVKEDKE
ncbi:MAG: hypothetical protein RR839_00540 [Oscillospiraceae bacterium]